MAALEAMKDLGRNPSNQAPVSRADRAGSRSVLPPPRYAVSGSAAGRRAPK